MTTHRGFPACTCLADWCAAFEALIGRQPRLFQLVGDAPASAGFHRGGGSADYEPLSEDELRIARNMGGAAWNRWWSGNYHCHIRLNGCPHNTISQPQVEDLNEGRDGTGPLYDNAGEADNGPRDGVRWPLRTWRQGIAWAREQGDDMANYRDWDQKDKDALVGDLVEGIMRYKPHGQKLAVEQLLKQAGNAPKTVRAEHSKDRAES
jgi:hypothetical protein